MKRSAIIFFLLCSFIGGVIWYGNSLPVKSKISASRSFNYDTNEIWRLIIEYKKYPEWRENVYAVQQVPSKTKYDAWKEVDEDGNTISYQFLDYEPGMHITLQATGKSAKTSGKWNFRVTANEDGKSSTLTITEDSEMPELLPRVINHLLIDRTENINAYFRSIDNKFIGDELRNKRLADKEIVQ